MKEIERASLKMSADACIDEAMAMDVDVDGEENPFLVRKSTSSASVASSATSQSTHLLQFTQPQFAAAVATRTSAFLSKFRSDLSIKEDLIRQFEVCQAEYNSMRRSYDEKIKLMHENLQRAQKERDQALLKNKTTLAPAAAPPPGIKAKYEDRIRILGKELNEMRSKLDSANKSLNTRASTSTAALKNLTKQLDVAKAERAKLSTRLVDETARLRQDALAQDSEIKEVRQRERRAHETAIKLKKAYDFQRALLQKRIEQHQQARHKIKQLLLALRKRQLPTAALLQTLDSPSWRSSASELDEIEMDVDDGVVVVVDEDDNYDDDEGACAGAGDKDEFIDPTHTTHTTHTAHNTQNTHNTHNTHTTHNTSDINSDDEILDLQLNAETQAVLNEDVEMIGIDLDDSATSSQISGKFNVSMSPSDLEANSTGELPRSALRNSPLIGRRPRDGHVEDFLKKRKPFK
jgi:hypothetical protein